MRITKSWLREARHSLEVWVVLIARMSDDQLLEEFRKKYPHREPDMTPKTPAELRVELIHWGINKFLPYVATA